MRVLIIGQGGREHALAWRAKQSPQCETLFCAPGNAGISRIAECVQLEMKQPFTELMAWVAEKKIDLVIVGPEAPLAEGIVDHFATYFGETGPRIFGPTKQAAQLESSKVFCKEFLQKYHIPTAKSRTCTNEAEVARAKEQIGLPLVLKADGLAAGKGVWVCMNDQDYQDALAAFFVDERYGEASKQILVEEFLPGEEASFFALCDGEDFISFPTSQDHKRIGEGDTGLNTGGMGAYSPAPILDQQKITWIENHVISPTLQGMKKEGHPFVGFLYAGLMVSPKGEIHLLEYNVRLGDPEAQALMMRMDGDLLHLIQMALDQKMNQVDTKDLWNDQSSACVVMASKGYPLSYEKGFEIHGLDAAAREPDVEVFHAGTELRDGQIVNAGGRVLGVSARGQNLQNALDRVYKAVDQISWQGGDLSP